MVIFYYSILEVVKQDHNFEQAKIIQETLLYQKKN